MVAGRLTGLEFHWFSRGQLMAARYEQNTMLHLESSVAELMSDITKDAEASTTGPSSLRRVADRFMLDADAIQSRVVEPSPSFPRLPAIRQVEALRVLAANFEAAASKLAA
jgi:hypothetical protein